MIRWLAALAIAGLLIGPAHPLVLAPTGGCSQAATFVNRTSGENTVELTKLICGLVTAGLIDNSASMASAGGNPYCGSTGLYDRLYIFAMASQANANKDVCGHADLTPNGSPSWIANLGYAGAVASTTIYLDTGFIPSTSGVRYALDSAHASTWSFTSVPGSSGESEIGALSTSSGLDRLELEIDSNTTDSRIFVNQTTNLLATPAGFNGYFVINRSDSGNVQVYRNAVMFGSGAITSSALPSIPVYLLNRNFTTINSGSDIRLGMASLGGSMDSGKVTSSNTLFCNYFTAVHGSC